MCTRQNFNLENERKKDEICTLRAQRKKKGKETPNYQREKVNECLKAEKKDVERERF